jgi:hypothetical protein
MSNILPQSTGRRAWSVNEFCQALGIARSSFYKEANRGRIKTFVVAGRRLVADTEFQRLQEGDSALSPIRGNPHYKRGSAKT